MEWTPQYLINNQLTLTQSSHVSLKPVIGIDIPRALVCLNSF